jgi:hypothetical protein
MWIDMIIKISNNGTAKLNMTSPLPYSLHILHQEYHSKTFTEISHAEQLRLARLIRRNVLLGASH